MSEQELKKKLFEIMFTLDSKSAGKDYVALRNNHYGNMEWLHDNGLQEEYYEYFISQIKSEVR